MTDADDADAVVVVAELAAEAGGSAALTCSAGCCREEIEAAHDSVRLVMIAPSVMASDQIG